MTYTVKYKPKGAWCWRTIKKVVGDGIVTVVATPSGPSILQEPYRFFTTEDNAMVHVPLSSEVIFGKERDAIIAKNMSKTIGQQVQR
jgi:hypothetical protein